MQIKRPTIGLCVIAKNEANNLPRLLYSVRDCVDEIYLTDTGSTDDTVEIAKEYGAQISHFEWVNDFSAARNFNFSQAKTDYVLWLDCDDALGNPEEFKMWRDTMMVLGDYHLAPYWYAIDAQGKPTCTFIRERVVKNGLFNWRYPVHEGLIPESAQGPAKCLPVKTWHVIHHRTQEDLAKDKGRNVAILERQAELDPRMQYYYGKELFEMDRVKDCMKPLETALSNPKLELHDRIIGMQYLCYAYIKESLQLEQAGDANGAAGYRERTICLALSALQISPSRAEFLTLIADSLIKKGALSDSIAYLSASKHAVLDYATPINSAIFHNKELYTTYPRNQLCRVYAHLGDLERAKTEALECIEKYNNEEAKTLYKELTKEVKAPAIVVNKTPTDDIMISCPMQAPYLWDGKVYREKAMGGSETAAIEMAEWMAKLSGRKVKIFNERSTTDCINGVEYIPTQHLSQYVNENTPFLHIAWRHNYPITDPRRTFLWCHDLYTPGGEQGAHYNKIMALTEFHRRFLMVNQGIMNDKIWVTRNGLNPDKFKMLGGHWNKDPWKFVFSSSPDRGLDRAMRVLDRVREKYPEIKLHVAYGIEHLHKYGRADLQAQLKAMMDERKSWVIYEGAMEQQALMQLFKSAAYCVQPSDFLETSMLSALERACCGVYQVIRHIGGVVDTLGPIAEKGMANMVFSDCITESEYELYANEVIDAIESQSYMRVNVDANDYAWKDVAETWLSELPKMF